VVPGHGPITDVAAVAGMKAYFEYVRDEARKRFEAGIGWEEAARDLTLGEFAAWSDAERIVGNVFALYREFGARLSSADEAGLFGAMGRWRKQHSHAG